ncbi:MAG: hypothetical protein HQL51_06255 [Magnetococcales bacterium]|nr:hypothetical protein [Magnetococcales bacterium]
MNGMQKMLAMMVGVAFLGAGAVMASEAPKAPGAEKKQEKKQDKKKKAKKKEMKKSSLTSEVLALGVDWSGGSVWNQPLVVSSDELLAANTLKGDEQQVAKKAKKGKKSKKKAKKAPQMGQLEGTMLLAMEAPKDGKKDEKKKEGHDGHKADDKKAAPAAAPAKK